jgi:SNF2 family DNA or RNA helicase
MSQISTVLLFDPRFHFGRSGSMFQLLRISKMKDTVKYDTEELNIRQLKKYLPKLPQELFHILAQFEPGHLSQLKAGMKEMAALSRNEQGQDLGRINFHKKLQDYFRQLRPFFKLLSFYHQLPLPGEKNRFRMQLCRFSELIPELSFKVVKEDDLLTLEVEFLLNGSPFPIEEFEQFQFLLRSKGEYFTLRVQDFLFLEKLKSIDWQVLGADPQVFVEQLLAPMEEDYKVDRNGLIEQNLVEVPMEARVLLSEISGAHLMLTPQFEYDGFVFEAPWVDTVKTNRLGREYLVRRNRETEAAFEDALRQLHPNFERQINGYFYLSFSEAEKKNWFLKTFRHLLDTDVKVIGMDLLKHFRYCTDLPETTLELSKEEGPWMHLKFSLRFGKEEVPFNELQKVIRDGQQALLLKDNRIALLEEDWMKKYALVVRHAVLEKKQLKLSKVFAYALEQSEEPLFNPILKEEWKARWTHWQLQENPLYELPSVLQAKLRIYQQKGFEWMKLLREIGAGMFLADDMGLGKTLQTICYLSDLLLEQPARKVLIACPASLIYNWESEFGKFSPRIRVKVYHGADRDKTLLQQPEVQVVVTSYGTLRYDEETFLGFPFLAIVLDESQAIKNPDSQTTRLVHQLRADTRLLLSGTPVMNNTFDLYSQMQFILPGLLGNREFFRREYAEPIDRYSNQQKMAELKKITAPFILRRTKDQVATDLPPKTEITWWCRMGEEQQEVYNQLKTSVKSELKQAIKDQGMDGAKLKVLQGIMRLRQACNSPLLLKDETVSCTDSVKLEELVEELQGNLRGQKVLVFSQFTSMLDLIARSLRAQKIPYFLLTGATPPQERARLVEQFNHPENETPVFLLSLKAGNAGLNLTAAGYVFLFDPWWNSAVEQQAIDRTHRIGQSKNVFAYKMVCKNTIEEKIIQLQERKKQLAAELIAEESGFVKALTEDDIEFLFE